MIRNVGKKIKEQESATIRVLAVVVVFIILETPEIASTIIAILDDFFIVDNTFTDSFSDIARFMSLLNRFVNFFIYCATGRQFRRGVVELYVLIKGKVSRINGDS
jgi:putative flippase GtrA